MSIVAMCVTYHQAGVSVGKCPCSAFVYVEVDRVDTSTAAGDTEITIRLRNENPANTLQAVA